MKRLLALVLLLAGLPAHASMEVDGAWRAGVWATTAWATGVWYEGAATCTERPTVLAGLSPAAVSGDVLDADDPLLTTAGKVVTLNANGTYCVEDDSTDGYFTVRLFDQSTATWHVMGGADGFRVYVAGTVRLDDYIGSDAATVDTTLQGLGLSTTLSTGCSSSVMTGEVARLSLPAYSLLPAGTSIEIFEATGPCTGSGGKLRLNLKLRL